MSLAENSFSRSVTGRSWGGRSGFVFPQDSLFPRISLLFNICHLCAGLSKEGSEVVDGLLGLIPPPARGEEVVR